MPSFILTSNIFERFGAYLSRQLIKKYLPSQTKYILDVGCGFNAHNSINLKKKGYQIHLLDEKINKTIQGNNVKIYEGDFFKILPKLNKNFYEFIINVNVLEHLTDRRIFLKHLYYNLKTDGTLIINVPSKLGQIVFEFLSYKLKIMPKEQIEDHKIYYTKKKLMEDLLIAGFEKKNIKIFYVKFGMCIFVVLKK